VVPGGLCEREGELARVDALLTSARAGHGGVLLITGPAGIGKTVLLGAARERASRSGMRVLAGRGGELESGFSFGVARQLFEPLLAGAGPAEREALLAGAARRALIALEGLRDQAGAAPEAESEPPFAVIHGLYWLTVNASGAGPVLVTVDDLHWADQASLRFLLYLADRLAGLPIALGLSWRVRGSERRGSSGPPRTDLCRQRDYSDSVQPERCPGAAHPGVRDCARGTVRRGVPHGYRR
jgi:AAA ATPase domain